MDINLGKFRGNKSTLFTGREHGKMAREILKLDDLDKTKTKINFIIPEGTSSLNPSFFLGLFYDSFLNLKSVEEFDNKYTFRFMDDNPKVVQILKSNIEDAKRNALNALENKIGFKRFFRLT